MTLTVDARIPRGDFRVTVAFEAAQGATLALLGPNGSGKSTLVACLAGLLPPEAGTVVLDGRSLDDPSASIHVAPEERPIGVVFQDGLLFPNLSALENAAFPLRAAGGSKAGARERAAATLRRLGFPDARVGARPADLSGGEIQRVALARALVREPRLLLLDEPTSSLDVRSRAEIRGVIRSTFDRFDGIRLLVTHDPVEAMTLADRVVVLEGGRVTQWGTPDELRNAPRTHYVADLVGVNLFAGRLEPLGDGAGRLVTADGDVVVPWPDDAPGEPVEGALGVLRPADVALHVAPPAGSARNVLHGTIADIAIEGERARVRLLSRPPVVAEVTRGSVDRLGLRVGDPTWASFKAVEVELILP